MAIRVVTDSASDLPAELAASLNVTVIPCNVVIDDVTYKDGVDIHPDGFYERLLAGPRLPTTSQPSLADFQTFYQDLLDQGHQILSIHVSGKLSGTMNSAERAREALGNPDSIELVDSQLASLGLGLVVIAAAEEAAETDDLPALAAHVRTGLPATQCIITLDTLEYLQKGGRIGKAQAFLGSMLSVKPILRMEDGEVHPVERPRNAQRALRRIGELAREYAPLKRLGIIYSTEPQRAEQLKSELSGLVPEAQLVTSRFGPTLGTYVGPGAVAVVLTRE